MGMYSDDDGETWTKPEEIAVPRSIYDAPNKDIPSEWIVWQKPLRLGKNGNYLVGVSRYAYPSFHATKYRTSTQFIHFDNVDKNPPIKDLIVRWVHMNDQVLRMGVYCEEPAIVKLPDGRLFCVMRTGTGFPCWTQSRDDGETWSEPKPLLMKDGGDKIAHPLSPCPIYDAKGNEAASGLYFMFAHNTYDANDKNPWQNRGPLFFFPGRFQKEAEQPVWFDKPTEFISRPTNNSFYTSLTVLDGKTVLWYPDQKFYLLGRIIGDNFFAKTPISLQTQQIPDSRNILNGSIIPDKSYSDQPYIVKTDDGAWLSVLTTGSGHEGATGQNVVTQRSLDQGKTWTDWVDLEPFDGPESAYGVLLKAPSGRVFAFYNHNTDNQRTVLSYEGKEMNIRVDCLGYFVFRYSDDHGKTWSQQRYTIPVREFEIDRKNVYKGKIRFFWTVGRAFEYKGMAYVPLIKIGGDGGSEWFKSTEGVLLQSPDLFTVKDPANAQWITLPDGDIGLRAPMGGDRVAEEQSFVTLSDGSLYCVYRTIDGYPTHTYSRDGGHTWDAPQYMTYANGRLVKHPRAANFVWKCENGKYLYWYHNHGGRFIVEKSGRQWINRNPVWMLGGLETDSPKGKIIQWSQPELLLYDDDPMIRMSYPDLVEDKGNYYVTETQKDIARVHQISTELITGLWGQFGNKIKTTNNLVLNWSYNNKPFPQSVKNVTIPGFYVVNNNASDYSGIQRRTGYTVELAFKLSDLTIGQILLDARTADGEGWCVRTAENQKIEIIMSDGQTMALWNSDEGAIKPNQEHYMSIVVDAGPHIISFIIDGILNDGGSTRQFGWGRFSPNLQSVTGSNEIIIGKKFNGTITEVNIYDRALKTSEAIGNYKSYNLKN